MIKLGVVMFYLEHCHAQENCRSADGRVFVRYYLLRVQLYEIMHEKLPTVLDDSLT